jgi:hypothetical protein
MVAKYGTPEEQARVRSAVARRFPGLGKTGFSTLRPRIRGSDRTPSTSAARVRRAGDSALPESPIAPTSVTAHKTSQDGWSTRAEPF